MDKKPGSSQVAISAVLVASLAAGCGSSGKSQGNLCEKLCANEAKLGCPLGDEAGCRTGCQNFYDSAKATYTNCTSEIDSVFDCTGNVPVSSIQCNPSSSSPIYAAGTCSAQNTALATCTAATSGSCNTVTPLLVTVTGTADPGPLPAMTGGTIVRGTYVETSVVSFLSSVPLINTQQETLVFSGTQMDAVSTTNGGAEERYTGSLTTPGGNEITVQITCTSPTHSGLITTAYTATETELQVIWETNVVHTYVRQ